MSGWLVMLVTLAYVWTSAEQFILSNPGPGIMFLGYAVANLGVILVLK